MSCFLGGIIEYDSDDVMSHPDAVDRVGRTEGMGQISILLGEAIQPAFIEWLHQVAPSGVANVPFLVVKDSGENTSDRLAEALIGEVTLETVKNTFLPLQNWIDRLSRTDHFSSVVICMTEGLNRPKDLVSSVQSLTELIAEQYILEDRWPDLRIGILPSGQV